MSSPSYQFSRRWLLAARLTGVVTGLSRISIAWATAGPQS